MRMQRNVQSFHMILVPFYCFTVDWSNLSFSSMNVVALFFFHSDLPFLLYSLRLMEIITYGHFIIWFLMVNWILSQFSCSKHLNRVQFFFPSDFIFAFHYYRIVLCVVQTINEHLFARCLRLKHLKALVRFIWF